MMEKNYLFPVFLKTSSLRILLVGGGKVGAEKLRALLSSNPDARIYVVADRIESSVKQLSVKHANVRLIQRKFELTDLNDKDVVFLATDNIDLHKCIVKETRRRNILTNVADTPDLCDFYLGSIVSKGNLRIGISTNGKSPTMAKRMRQFLDSIIPENFDPLLENLYQLRNSIQGDFQRKVDRLNEVTQSFIGKNTQDKISQD